MLLLLGITAFGGCRKQAPSHIAKLSRVETLVESQKQGVDWGPARVGEVYHLGDAVRTSASSSAELVLRRGGRLRMEADSIVRFLDTPGEAMDFDVETGSVEIEAAEEELVLELAMGTATIERKGAVRLRAADDQLRVNVVLGNVVLENHQTGETTTLAQGRSITVDIGGVVLEDDRSAEAGKPAAKPTAKPPDGGATVATVAAKVSGDDATIETGEGWKTLDEGRTNLAVGSRIRVKKDSAVELERGGERVVAKDAEFVVGGADDVLLSAAYGDVEVYATTESTRIEVPGGVIVVRGRPGGSRADVAVGTDQKPTRVSVRRGEADLRTSAGDETLAVGESAELSARGEIEVSYRSPRYVEFSMSAGESPMIHDPKAPTAIRVVFGGVCSGEGVLEVSGDRSFRKGVIRAGGKDGANVRLAPGYHRYRVRCQTSAGLDKEPQRSGSVTVTRDAGRRELPLVPPHTALDADGRDYSVLYQNRLPELTFRWPKAARGRGYTLHLEREGKPPMQIQTSQPSYTFPSGKVLEGSYRWWFVGDGDGARSPETGLTVDFDNAAAKVYLKTVACEADTCHIEGAVIEGWSVNVNGADIELDKHRRFSIDAAPSGEENGVAVRISHPKRGLHYYLVRVRDR